MPSPQDLIGKILIKNKKNQFTSVENCDPLKKTRGPEDEAVEQPTPTDKDSTGTKLERVALILGVGYYHCQELILLYYSNTSYVQIGLGWKQKAIIVLEDYWT